MKLLLDSHTFLWSTLDPDRLSPAARAALTDGDNELWLSLASCWELAIKVGLGKLTIAKPLDRVIADDVRASGLRLLPIELPDVLLAGSLPRHHGDPFDRLLVAQAQARKMALVTVDGRLAAYGVDVVW